MTHPHQIVILGGSGDLAKRKLVPALASLSRRGLPANGLDATLFLRSDEIEASWAFADSILAHWQSD